MFSILAAATVLVSAPPALPAPKPILVQRAESMRIHGVPPCASAGRLHTSFEPALLYREQDRANTVIKKLIELPQGQLCLAGGREPERRAADESARPDGR